LEKVIVNGQPTELKMFGVRDVFKTLLFQVFHSIKMVSAIFANCMTKMSLMFPDGEEGKKKLNQIFDGLKRKEKKKKYDCIVGISGGRDSTVLLRKVVKEWGLKPIAVHFNDGFDNPVAGENMVNACKILGVELRTITSDWREAKDLKISFLKASVPDLNLGTDIGIASSLYSVAHKEGIKAIIIGQSFRTEGVKPLSWSYFDGDYLRNVQKQFGAVKLKPWQADDAGFNLGLKELFYYTVIKGIKAYTPMYYSDYIRDDQDEIIKNELGWVILVHIILTISITV